MLCLGFLLCSLPEWQFAMSVITGPSTWAWLTLVDRAHKYTLCLWTNCSWSMITFFFALFYMYSETKGEGLASSFHLSREQFTLRCFHAYVMCSSCTGWAFGCLCLRCHMGLCPAPCCGRSFMLCRAQRPRGWKHSALPVTLTPAFKLSEVQVYTLSRRKMYLSHPLN